MELGFWFLIGLTLIVLFIAIKYILSKKFKQMRTKCSKKTDERISYLTEILNNIKIIKMYVWEEPFSQRATNFRKYIKVLKI